MNFRSPEYLLKGNQDQREVYFLLERHQVLKKLKGHDPILTGTFPLQLNIASSDLDIICSWKHQAAFRELLEREFSSFNNFRIKEKEIRGEVCLIAKFELEAYLVEVFGQDKPCEDQMAYRHMLAEYRLLQENGEELRKRVLELKRQGYKTEPAFAKALGIPGDPYLEILKF